MNNFKLDNENVDKATYITCTDEPLILVKIEKSSTGFYTTKEVLSFLIIPMSAPSVKKTLIEVESKNSSKEEREECLNRAFDFVKAKYLSCCDDIKEIIPVPKK